MIVVYSDWGYNTDNPVIPTPTINELSKDATILKQLYTHSICTPSRASLMTGRYHVNTGLTYVLTPSTPAGLPQEIPTVPQLLKEHKDYHTAMVGKWHLGHAKVSQTPVGRGFDSFTGLYMWDVDSYSKQMYEAPWASAMFIDWVTQHKNGSFHHFAEPAHVTEAITRDAIKIIEEHAKDRSSQPLFLYVAFTAAHSPLQPLPAHVKKCDHIPHEWRRAYCGMVVGLDEGVKNITRVLKEQLGENTIVLLSSDNGGSPWFGGMNLPLRGAKITPFEGGVRVPGFIYDYTSNHRYVGEPRVFQGLVHFSDWLPTILGFAGIEHHHYPKGLDGIDLSSALKDSSNVDNSPRNEILLEMYYPNEFIFSEGLVAYRIGDYKLIKGVLRDTNYYRESMHPYTLNISSQSWKVRVFEYFLHIGDRIFGLSNFDNLRITYTHAIMQGILARPKIDETSLLFNIRTDPTETTNLFNEPWAKPIIEQIEERIAHYERSRPPPQKAHYMFHLWNTWAKTHVPGDCSMNPKIRPSDCRFTHPWIPEVSSSTVLLNSCIDALFFVLLE